MTKQEFIAALHHACPAFMRDLKTYLSLVGPLLNRYRLEISGSDETRADPWTEVRRLKVEFQNKWPHYLSNYSPSLRAQGGPLLEIFHQAEAANVVLDPVRACWEAFRATVEHITKNRPESLLEKEPPNEVTIRDKNNEMKKNLNLRQSKGEDLFSSAAIVIPVYAYTNKDDIDWEAINQLKKRFYGESYHPKPAQYEKIIKVFQRGQLLKEKTGKEDIAYKYKYWQEVADSVGLRLSTVHYIYGRAHEVVYGRDKSDDTPSNPETVEEILKDNGPSRREPLVSELNRRRDNEQSDKNNDADERDSFRKVFDELREDVLDLCFLCHELKSAGHSDVTEDQYLKLGEYSSLPPYPNHEPFICNDCLTKIVSSNTTPA